MDDAGELALERELALARERLDSLVSTSIEMALCLEYEPPVSTELPADEQADLLLSRAVVAMINDAAALPYAGRKSSEIIGKRLVEAAPSVEMREVLRAQLREFVDQKYHHHHNEYALPRSDGSVSWVEVNRHATVVNGRVVRSWHMSRDVTERKRAARALEQAQRLESFGLLAGTITHDFNNLLAAFSANLDAARLDLSRGRSPEHAFAAMDEAVQRARALTRRILAFSRPEADLRRAPLSLGSIVEECARLVTPGLPPTVSLEVRLAPDLPRVAADATQMHQVLMNLVQNGVHAAEPDGGAVTVTLERVGERVRLAVRDTGPGMDAQTRERIFDPFFTTKPGGTGLGLSIVHRIVSAHDGTISVTSAPGAGTTVEVTLATLAPVAPSSGPARSRRVGREGVHVLFVDDEPRIAELTAHVLVHHGFRVSPYTDPKVALDAFLAAPDEFDVVVTDHTMPTMSGLALARRIVERRPDVPVLLASGQPEPPSPEVLERAGIVGALPKPFPISTLAERIRAALARS